MKSKLYWTVNFKRLREVEFYSIRDFQQDLKSHFEHFKGKIAYLLPCKLLE